MNSTVNNIEISLIIPMYNEISIIENTARTLHDYMKKTFGEGRYEIIFSNDGSTDRCDQALSNMNLNDVIVTGYKKNCGKGRAVRVACLEAKGKYVMFTDADLAYGTDIIKRIYDMFIENVDTQMIIGSRNLSKDGYEGYTFIRKIASKAYIKILCVIGGFNLSDSQCGCKAFTGEAAKKIFSRCEVDGFAFDFEAIMLAIKYNMKIKEIPVKIINHRESKVSVFRDSFKMIKDMRLIKKRIKNLTI